MNYLERIYNLLTETDTAGYFYRKNLNTGKKVVRRKEGEPYVDLKTPTKAKK